MSPFLFAIVIDEFTRVNQNEISRFMLFIDNIVLVDETTTEVNAKIRVIETNIRI